MLQLHILSASLQSLQLEQLLIPHYCQFSTVEDSLSDWNNPVKVLLWDIYDEPVKAALALSPAPKGFCYHLCINLQGPEQQIEPMLPWGKLLWCGSVVQLLQQTKAFLQCLGPVIDFSHFAQDAVKTLHSTEQHLRDDHQRLKLLHEKFHQHYLYRQQKQRTITAKEHLKIWQDYRVGMASGSELFDGFEHQRHLFLLHFSSENYSAAALILKFFDLLQKQLATRQQPTLLNNPSNQDKDVWNDRWPWAIYEQCCHSHLGHQTQSPQWLWANWSLDQQEVIFLKPKSNFLYQVWCVDHELQRSLILDLNWHVDPIQSGLEMATLNLNPNHQELLILSPGFLKHFLGMAKKRELEQFLSQSLVSFGATILPELFAMVDYQEKMDFLDYDSFLVYIGKDRLTL